MSPRHVLAACLGLGALLPGLLAAGIIADSARPLSGFEAALEREGWAVERSQAVGPAVGTPDAPDMIVITNGWVLTRLEWSALRPRVEAGADLVVFGSDPVAAAGPAAAGMRTLPGRLHEIDGTAARLVGPTKTPFRQEAMRALETENQTLFLPLLTAPTAFRDTDLNGQFDVGEPSGPFVVAAFAPVGQGRVILAAMESPTGELARELAGSRDDGVARVLGTPWTWAMPSEAVMRTVSSADLGWWPAIIAFAAGAALAALAWAPQDQAGVKREDDARARFLELERQRQERRSRHPGSR
jgi:hypothetical protein